MNPFKEKFLNLYKMFPGIIDEYVICYQDGEMSMIMLRLTVPSHVISDDQLNEMISMARIGKTPVGFEDPIQQTIDFNPKLTVNDVSLWREEIRYNNSKHYVEYIHLEVRKSWWLKICEWLDEKLN